MKKYLFIVAISIAIYGIISQVPESFSIRTFFSFFKSEPSTSDKALQDAFKNNVSDIQVGGSGKVIKILQMILKVVNTNDS